MDDILLRLTWPLNALLVDFIAVRFLSEVYPKFETKFQHALPWIITEEQRKED